jgi:hypothetical protein
MSAKIISRWRAFLDESNPFEHQGEALLEFVGAAVAPDWSSCPVAGFAPEMCVEFRTLSHAIGEIYIEKGENARAEAFRAAPPLFHLGCYFGDALEAMGEAYSLGDVEGQRTALDAARAAWLRISMWCGGCGSSIQGRA